MTQAFDKATDRGVAMRTLHATYDDRHTIRRHDHAWGQLVCAASGAIQVVALNKVWRIPPTRAV